MTPFVFNARHYIQNHRCRLCGSLFEATRASSGGELPGPYGRRTMATRYGEGNRHQETTVMLSFILRWFADRRCDDERSRQALSSYASHDLRSPMTTIREAVALLADGVPGKINDKQRRLLSIVLERAETWLRLVDEVVVLPQWASDGSPLHLREESLPDVAYESVEKTKGRALVRGATVTVKFPDSLPKITVDRLRLGQALTILLAAVISSTEQGGQVRLSLKLVSETEMQVDVSSTNAKRLIEEGDRKSTRLNSSHSQISYAVFCLKKKNHN